MKKLKGLVIIMGVLLLQSCSSYRVKVITSGNNQYYFPQKRILYEWEDIPYEMFVDLESAMNYIDHKIKFDKLATTEYIKYNK